MPPEIRVARRVPFNKPCLVGTEIENIRESLRGGVVSGDGPFNRLCESSIEELIGARRVLLTPSGTDALELAGLLAGVGPGDEVVMPSFTFVSTANAFCLRGARPVFVDIRPDTLNLDESALEAAITPRTRAIVPVHYGGVACEMDPLLALAAAHGLRVIEDAAQGFLATYRGRHLGTLGDIGCFSFHETKTIMCGEGGAVVLNRDEDVARAEVLHEKGTDRKTFMRGGRSRYEWVDLGSSFVLGDLLAAFLHGQIQAREEIIARRGRVFRRYEELLAPLVERGLARTPFVPAHCTINFHLFFLLVEDAATRGRLLDHLHERGVGAVFHYVPLHASPFARGLGIDCRLPVTESLSERLIRLPFYNDLSPEDQGYVAETILEFYGL